MSELKTSNTKRKMPAAVIVFGLVSFLTDVSSDMIYPLLPLFLVEYLGAGQGILGLIEGVAESTAAFFTLLSGLWADRVRDRSKLVLGGYSLSSFFRPLMALAWHPWAVLAVRFFDRMGKGIRTAPRDALIADATEPQMRGAAYGLQRSMDHAGALTGPILASLLLWLGLKNLRHLFALAAIPGILAVILIAWKIREVRPALESAPKKLALKIPRGRLRIYLIILFVFILSCSSDAFLLLRIRELGIPTVFLPLMWALLHVVKALSTYPLGKLSDRMGRRHVMLAGWIIYALVYAGFGMAQAPWQAVILFCFYGLYYGFTEGTERALLADYAEKHERGQAFGWYYFILGLGVLPASLVFGTVWQTLGSSAAFYLSAGISAGASFGLFVFLKLVPSKLEPSPAVPAKPSQP